MNNRIARCFLLLALASLTGCAVFDKGYAVQPLDSSDAFISYQSIRSALIKGSADSPGLVPPECFNIPIPTEGDVKARCTAARNQAIAVMAFASSELCQLHRQSIYGREAVANITLGSLTSLAAGGAAVAGSRGAKTLYGALACSSTPNARLSTKSSTRR